MTTERLSDARVLVTTLSASDDGDVSEPATGSGDDEEATRVAEAIRSELGAETVVKQGATASEYLREFAPLLDCAVCLADDADAVSSLAAVGPSVPFVVYGDVCPTSLDCSVVGSDDGTEALVARVASRIERNRERSRLAEANAKLTALNTYTQEITACETREEVVDRVVGAVTEALAYERCVVGFVEGDELVPYGNPLPGEDKNTLRPDEGIAGRTYRTGESMVVDDYHSHPDSHRGYPQITSVASVKVDDYGILQVTAPDRAAFDDGDVEFLEIVAAHAAEALSRLERESTLRTERDRLHAFFDGLPAPTVYVESETGEPPVLYETNPAYEATFPSAPVGDPVESAFPTAVERRLFGESLDANGPVTESVRRDTAARDDASLTVTLVPVRTAGLAAAGYGVYVSQVTLP